MTAEFMSVETDVLVIGAGAAGMYAALEAARGGAQVILVDRSLIGRGGATVMAQMTVAVALGRTDAGSLGASSRRHARRRARPLRRDAGAILCEDAPARIREMDGWGVGWAREDGHITAGAGSRSRPAALRLCRFPVDTGRRYRRRFARG